MLAAVMAAPDARAQSVVDALRRDELAACILDSVDAGPFVRVSSLPSFRVCVSGGAALLTVVGYLRLCLWL